MLEDSNKGPAPLKCLACGGTHQVFIFCPILQRSMPATYVQLIEFVLTEVAKEGRSQFNLNWLHKQIRIRARKVKRRLGPRLNKILLRTLDHEARLGYLSLQRGSRDRDLSISMSAGGRHVYLTRSARVTIEAQTTSTARTRRDLLLENEGLKSELLNMETQLARANSLIDIENGGDAGIVTGLPANITERIQRLIVLSKNRKHQIRQMYEYEQDRRDLDLLNTYFEQDVAEREARDALVQEYRRWDTEERGTHGPGRGDREEGQDTPAD